MNKKLFWTSPYKVGPSRSNSLALVIPAKIVKEKEIDTSTIFLIKPEEKRIILERINFSEEKNTPAEERFPTSGQQVSREVH